MREKGGLTGTWACGPCWKLTAQIISFLHFAPFQTKADLTKSPASEALAPTCTLSCFACTAVRSELCAPCSLTARGAEISSNMAAPLFLTTCEVGEVLPGMGHGISQLGMLSPVSAVVVQGNSVHQVQWEPFSGSAESDSLRTPHASPAASSTRVLELPTSVFLCDVQVATHDGAAHSVALADTGGLVWLGGVGETGDLAEVGWATLGSPSGNAAAGRGHVSASVGATGPAVVAGAHSASQTGGLWSVGEGGGLTPLVAVGTPAAPTCVAAMAAGALADAPMMVVGTADEALVYDSRISGTSGASGSGPCSSLKPSAGSLVHMLWVPEGGAAGSLLTLTGKGIVERWDPRVWRPQAVWRAPCKYTAERMGASASGSQVWVAGTDNDVLAGHLPGQEADAQATQPAKRQRRGGGGTGREANVGGYTGPAPAAAAASTVDNTPARIKAGRQSGFRGGARWVGFDVWSADVQSPCVASGVSEAGVLYSVAGAEGMVQ